MTIKRILSVYVALCVTVVAAMAQEAPVKFAFLTDLHYSAGSGAVSDISRCVKDVKLWTDLISS